MIILAARGRRMYFSRYFALFGAFLICAAQSFKLESFFWPQISQKKLLENIFTLYQTAFCMRYRTFTMNLVSAISRTSFLADLRCANSFYFIKFEFSGKKYIKFNKNELIFCKSESFFTHFFIEIWQSFYMQCTENAVKSLLFEIKRRGFLHSLLNRLQISWKTFKKSWNSDQK